MRPIVILLMLQVCAKSNKLLVEALPLADADAGRHLKSSDLCLPMREVARVNYHC